MTDKVALGGLRAPGLARRLACFLYEGVLLFGLLMVAGLAYAIVTNQRHALVGAWGLKAFLFLVLGGYFVWFWSRHGQTLAMRTWHIRLLTRAGQPVARWRAVCRYLLAWLWLPRTGVVGQRYRAADVPALPDAVRLRHEFVDHAGTRQG